MNLLNDIPIWRDTALIVAFFTLIGCIVQFLINPFLNNYLERKKENQQKEKTFRTVKL